MTYEQYAAQMKHLITKLMSYDIGQVGCGFYASKCADLEEAHPEHAARFDEEIQTA